MINTAFFAATHPLSIRFTAADAPMVVNPIPYPMTINASTQEDPSSVWTNTIDAKSVADWIAERETIVLLTHTKPDGDALGSTLAIARAIIQAPFRLASMT